MPLFILVTILSSFPQVEVGKIHDGDTFQVDIPGYPSVFGDGIPIRIAGIDTAEINDKRACARADAIAARMEIESLIKDQAVDLVSCSRDKFFRLDCQILVNGVDVGKRLLARKLAKPYNGDAKTEWVCSRH